MRRDHKVLKTTQIKVVGVGCGGSNAVNCMISAGSPNLQFITVNADSRSLAKTNAPYRIQIGEDLTGGLGTGGKPTVAKKAAFDAANEIKDALVGTEFLYITAGLGRGTGSGAAPVIAKIAQELGIITIAVVTRPFHLEGNKPTRIAKEAIKELEKYVDYLIVFPTNQLLSSANNSTSLKGSFRILDNVLCQGVQVINEFVNHQGLINLDLADLKSIMAKKGATLMTVGRAQGVDRARIAAERALVCPILGLSIHGARGLLINITASSSLNLGETQTITNILKNTTHLAVDFVLGIVIDETMGNEIRISVVATGFHNEDWDIWADNEQPGRIKLAETAVAADPVISASESRSKEKRILGFSFRNFPLPGFLRN